MKKQKMACGSEEVIIKEPVSPDERYIRWIAARKLERYAWDHQLYTIDEFSNYYGREAGKSLWKSAIHFKDVKEFCNFFDLKITPRSSHHSVFNSEFASSPAMFGLWVPGCLLLVDMHHFGGKLKHSRLSPDAWQTDIWDTAWRIGPVGREMVVLEFCIALHRSEHLLGKLGQVEMTRVLQDFCDILDGNYAAGLEC